MVRLLTRSVLNPGANSVVQAGGGVQSITWTNPTSGNVSLALYSGTNPVVTVTPLTDSIPNTGTYLWTPETWLPAGNDYTIGVSDLTGNAPTQYSPFFTVQLCSTCSASTRASTSSFAAQTVSVAGLDIGTRSAAAYPTQAVLAAAASGSQVSSGVANTDAAAVATASGSGSRASVLPTTSTAASLGGAAIASQASVLGASADAILSMTGASTGAASTATSTTQSSDADAVRAGLVGLVGLAAVLL